MPTPGRRRLKPSPVRPLAVLAIAVLAGGVLSACGGPVDEGDGSIALLLPDAKTARYETFDRPFFEARVAELGDYRVQYANADQDAAKQQQQAESALAAGVDVLVLDPVDATAAVSIVTVANSEDVPVVSYDRLIGGGELAYYVSFDNEKVGRLQAEAFVDALEAEGAGDGGVLLIHGSPTDSNAELFRSGAQEVIGESGLDVLAEYDTPGWNPENAQQWVTGQIALYGSRIAGVYAANDATAGGAVAALKAANVAEWPIVTGQDAELTAIQRILVGDQHMTVYKAIKPQAELAAEVAVALIEGDPITAPMVVDGVPTTLLDPVAVTVDDIADTVIADGFWTVDDICTPAYAEACAAAGIG